MSLRHANKLRSCAGQQQQQTSTDDCYLERVMNCIHYHRSLDMAASVHEHVAAVYDKLCQCAGQQQQQTSTDKSGHGKGEAAVMHPPPTHPEAATGPWKAPVVLTSSLYLQRSSSSSKQAVTTLIKDRVLYCRHHHRSLNMAASIYNMCH